MKTVTPLQLPVLNDSKLKTYWGNLQGSSLSLAIAQMAITENRLCLIVTPDSTTSNYIENELKFFLNEQTQTPIIHFPDRETLPYDIFSPHQDIISERLFTLYRLPHIKSGVIISSVSTLMHYLPPQTFLQQHSFAQSVGDQIIIEDFRTRLANANYRSVSEVLEHGEYAIRGSIIDIFPMGANQPYRIDLFDNEIESIRIFDPETQKSINTVEKINLLPAREFSLTDEAISHFRQKWRSEFTGNPLQSPIYQAISDGLTIAGIEYYIPLFFGTLATFFDYLPQNTLICKLPELATQAENFWTDVSKRYEQKRYDITRPLLTPESLFLKNEAFFHALNQFKQIELNREAYEKEHDKQLNFETIKPADLPIQRKSETPLQLLDDYINTFSGRILLCAESLGRREALLRLLAPLHKIPTYCENWHDFLKSDIKLGIAVAPLETGFCLPTENLALIAESQIFGLQVLQTRRRSKTSVYEADSQIKDLLELTIGSPIVHIEHGIGRYLGLQTLTVGEITAEYLVLEYADQNKLYVPVSALNLITRYTGTNMEAVPLSKLGTEQWTRSKRKAIEKIRDVAAELLKLHAKRASKKGFTFKLDETEYAKFSSAFPFETTVDQEKAINDVFNDMQSGIAMDRLICGDVGFGKTEVAMRSAFLAVLNNKQVAVLVPTTLLAQQHYQTFCDRMADWPIRIEMLSRFRSAAEQTQILADLKEKKYDIVIGTHKLLQKNIEFQNLGLLVVDEEHRFGVQQKEKIKQLRAEVDILTLTATPIPRTLNMALSGVRDLSIIATPPAKRLAIKTFVQEYNPEMIREAILREIARGGQIYYLHNEVTTIENKVAELNALLPEIKINFAHGQMRERELERIMSDFYHHRFNLLVATTIIESGIDIPTANTIIIENADKFGLAQLHQLRGRVGRSHHQAYAYLLVSPTKKITKDAEKRLEAISSSEELGSGFILATHDLEIRGSGEILGAEQSGHMEAIGFSLYMDLLARAVKSLEAGEPLNLEENLSEITEIELRIPALIPEEYMHDVHLRLLFYKRIANAKDIAELDAIQVEMIDRFGLLPKPAKNLFKIAELKLFAFTLGIRKLEANNQTGIITFVEKPNVDPEHLIHLIQTKPKEFKFDGSNAIRFYLNADENTLLIEKIESVLMILKKCNT